jgi:hypothetical protein
MIRTGADDIYLEATVKAKKAYDSLIHAGIAPEQARAVFASINVYQLLCDRVSVSMG